MNALELKELRGVNNLSQQDMANLLGKKLRAVQSWEQERRNIPQSVVILIKKLFEDGILKENNVKSEDVSDDLSESDTSFEALDIGKKIDVLYKLSLGKLSTQEKDILFLSKKVDGMRETIIELNAKIERLTDKVINKDKEKAANQ